MLQITKQQLKITYWFTIHKSQIKKALIISLIVLNLGFWGYNIYGLIVYFSTAKNQEAIIKNLTHEMINWPVYHLKHKPENLILSEITVIPLEKGRYDLIVQVENPNLKWAISDLDYRFVWLGNPGASVSGWQKNFFLPEEKKFLLGLNLSSSQPIENPQIEFQNIQWKKIKPKTKLAEVNKSDFLIENIHFTRKTGIIPSKVQFEVTNRTNYNFWEVNFKVILYQGRKIIGANFVSTTQFLSEEKRLFETFWTSSLPSVTKIYIEPEVNILDEKIFMGIESGTGEEK